MAFISIKTRHVQPAVTSRVRLEQSTGSPTQSPHRLLNLHRTWLFRNSKVDLNEHFRGLLGRIEPNPAHVKAAKRAHEELREHIREHPDVREAHRDTYLSGSYARHTAIKNIKDVDVICVLDVDRSKNEPIVVLRWLEAAMLDYYSK